MEVNLQELPSGNDNAIKKTNLLNSKVNSTAKCEISSENVNTTKILKRCLSVPIIPPTRLALKSSNITTRSATAAAAQAAGTFGGCMANEQDLPKKTQIVLTDNSNGANSMLTGCILGNNTSTLNIGIPRSNPSSREVSPAPVFNIFAPRARRYSASYSPVGGVNCATTPGSSRCVTPRVSQLRQEECIDMNSREINHEREVHSVMQMSQSWEDLTLVAENWSCKSDDLSNPLQVVLPSAANSCSSPSPTSNRAGMRLPYGLSPSPTRRTFATRRSMSPIAMRPSQLGPVKRKFELDDNSANNWNIYSQPPMKKIFTESRGSSPSCQSPSSVCPSPDSGTYDGRITPKLFISKLCTSHTNTTNSSCSSPMSASPNSTPSTAIDATTIQASLCSSMQLQTQTGIGEPMCIANSIDEGISVSESETEKVRAANDIQDDATLMDDMKSETSSIGGCSSMSIESSSCDSATKPSFLNKLVAEECAASLGMGQKHFFINKQGLSGAKKFIVNHDNMVGINGNSSNSSNSSSSSSSSSSSNSNSSSGGGGGGEQQQDNNNTISNVSREPLVLENKI
uniref:Protein FAM122A n=1 Tax=Glossina austeni TaxID=7395 RepID=A0A1A9UYL3_GLOAU